jgi:hypothetical protein
VSPDNSGATYTSFPNSMLSPSQGPIARPNRIPPNHWASIVGREYDDLESYLVAKNKILASYNIALLNLPNCLKDQFH